MKDYTVQSVKIWGGNKTKKRNEEGELAMTINFKEEPSVPVDYFSKIEPQEGDTLHGEMVDYVSNSGNHRTRFVTEESKRKENSKQNMIQAQWAIGQALQFASDHTNQKEIKDLAEIYIKIAKELADE